MTNDFWKKNKNLITASGFLLAITSLFLTIPQPDDNSAKFALSYLIISFFLLLFILLSVLAVKVYGSLGHEHYDKNRAIDLLYVFFYYFWASSTLYYLASFIYFSYKDVFFIFLEKFILPLSLASSLAIVFLIMHFIMKKFKKYLNTGFNWLDVILIFIGFYIFNFILTFLKLYLSVNNSFTFVLIKDTLIKSIQIDSFSLSFQLILGILVIVMFYYLQKDKIKNIG